MKEQLLEYVSNWGERFLPNGSKGDAQERAQSIVSRVKEEYMQAFADLKVAIEKHL